MTRARRGGPGPRAPRVALFGEVGVGNLGNDASFTAVAALLRARVPDVHVEVLGRDVGLGDGAHARPADRAFDGAAPLRSPHGLRLSRAGRTGAAARAAAKAADLAHLVRVVGGYDAVVVPGTGVLERQAGRQPGGVLVWLMLLAVACRVRGVPFAWFAIGGSSYASRWPAWTAGLAALGARHRTFRDAGTREALPGWSGARRDVVTHDVVLGWDEAAGAAAAERAAAGDDAADGDAAAGRRRVAVAVIDHDPPGRAGAQRRRRYVDGIAALVRSLAGAGDVVELVSADRADRAAVAAVLASLDDARGDGEAPRLHGLARTVVHAEEDGLDALLARLAVADVVVASRYHVLVAAALVRRPVVALSHADKDAALLRRAGLEQYVVPIDDLEPERVGRLVAAAHADGARVERLLDATCREAHASVHAEADALVTALGFAPLGLTSAVPTPAGRPAQEDRALVREAS